MNMILTAARDAAADAPNNAEAFEEFLGMCVSLLKSQERPEGTLQEVVQGLLPDNSQHLRVSHLATEWLLHVAPSWVAKAKERCLIPGEWLWSEDPGDQETTEALSLLLLCDMIQIAGTLANEKVAEAAKNDRDRFIEGMLLRLVPFNIVRQSVCRDMSSELQQEFWWWSNGAELLPWALGLYRTGGLSLEERDLLDDRLDGDNALRTFLSQ